MKNIKTKSKVAKGAMQAKGFNKELRKKNYEIKRLHAKLEAVERDRDAWREAADSQPEEKQLQCCLGTGRTGLIRAMRDAFA